TQIGKASPTEREVAECYDGLASAADELAARAPHGALVFRADGKDHHAPKPDGACIMDEALERGAGPRPVQSADHHRRTSCVRPGDDALVVDLRPEAGL